MSSRIDENSTALTADELDEEIPRILETIIPLLNISAVRFNFKAGEFIKEEVTQSKATLLHLTSNSVLRSSQNEGLLDEGISINAGEGLSISEDKGVPIDDQEKRESAIDKAPEADISQKTKELPTKLGRRQRKTPNAFNFCEDGTSAPRPTNRTVEISTSQPSYSEINWQVSLSTIFDAYAADYERKKEQQSKKKIDVATVDHTTPLRSLSLEPFKLADRLTCFNMFDGIAMDFRYFEDPADDFRSTGSLLPLWRLNVAQAYGEVTDVQWSQSYEDLIFVTFGSKSIDSPEKGALVLLSLKNCLHPEYARVTSSAALCLSVHPKYQQLVAIGLNDGYIRIYDVSSTSIDPAYKSNYFSKHGRGITNMKWEMVSENVEPSLLSISLDGQVLCWSMTALNLVAKRILTIPAPSTENLASGFGLKIIENAFSLAMNPKQLTAYCLGTSTGLIAHCNTLQHTSPVCIYPAHQLPVTRITFNKFCNHVFLTCSPDCSVKLWDNDRSEPLLSFELSSEVTDVAWSPLSSTVFVALTTDGCARVFDININRRQAIYSQRVVSFRNNIVPSRLTMNSSLPVFAIGDSHGVVTTFKMSPNLRLPAKQSKKELMTPKELEVRKLERVLSTMKPKFLVAPPDKPSVPD